MSMPALNKAVEDDDEEVEDVDGWMVTFTDAITLLLAFFVMMLTFTEFDIPAFEEAAKAITNEVGYKDELTTTEELKIEVEDVVFEMEADQVVKVGKDKRGIVIELASRSFFKPGSAELRKTAAPVLENITLMLAAKKYACFNIQVKGHTDDEPIRTLKFPTNWELSSARASRIVRYFVDRRLDEFRFQAIGLAATKPKVPNRDQEGRPIRQNQATNRRISLHVKRMSLEEQKRCNEQTDFKDILKKVRKQENPQNNFNPSPSTSNLGLQ